MATGDEVGPRRRRRGLSLTSRLAATVLGVGFVSMVAATLVGLNAGQTLGATTVDDALGSLASSGSYDVVAQVRFYQQVAEQLAASSQAADAIEELSAAFDELSAVPEADVRESLDDLVEVYEQTYLDPLRELGVTAAVRDIVSPNLGAVYLQAAFVLSRGSVQDALLIDDPGDGSEWSSVHARVHPVYRTTVREAGLLDLYLVDAATERIVYTATKGPDLGTSLSIGPYSGSVVGRAADAVSAGDDSVVTDLSFYNGVPGVPVGAAAAPVLRDGAVVGAVVITYDGATYTGLLTDGAEAASRDESSADDLYLIGGDGTTRSDPQSYLADPRAFVDDSVAAGVLSSDGGAVIDSTGTTVLVQPAVDSVVNAGADGDTDAAARTSMTGGDVINVVERLPLDDVDWYVASEVDVVAADEAVAAFRGILIVGAAIFVVTLAFVAVGWATRIMLPVRVISDRLGRASLATAGAPAVEPVTIADTSPVEFHRLADSFTAMGGALRRQQLDLRDARAERLDVLGRMLPPSLAQRIARGDLEAMDEVPSASVVVVVVLGLGDLVRDDGGGAGRALLDDLTAELDDIAVSTGLDRIKVVGDSYFAVCGHDRPYIDHAARAVAFAERTAAAVRTAGAASATFLDTAIGVNTGPVTVGMSGGGRLVFDVWGSTVTVAHDLARTARGGDLVITEATRVRLPADVALSDWRGGVSDEDGQPLWTPAPVETQARHE